MPKTSPEKTRQQEIELFFMEQHKKQKKWQQLSSQEKTRKQELDLLLQEQQQQPGPWQHLSGAEKTRLQEIALFLKENEKSVDQPQYQTQNPADFIVQMIALKEESPQQESPLQEDQTKKYSSEREFTSSETVQQMLGIKQEEAFQEQQTKQFTLSKIDVSAEKSLERNLFPAPDVKGADRNAKEVEVAQLQTAIIDSWQKGYKLEVQQKGFQPK